MKLPGRLAPFSPVGVLSMLSSSVICTFGTISSFEPLSMRIGVLGGIKRSLDAESHFWWQRNETGASRGRVVGIRRGRERKVFSRTSAFILGCDIWIDW